MVGGIDGTLPEEFGPAHGWFWDMSLNFGRTEEAGTKNGNVYLRNLGQAVGPAGVDQAVERRGQRRHHLPVATACDMGAPADSPRAACP